MAVRRAWILAAFVLAAGCAAGEGGVPAPAAQVAGLPSAGAPAGDDRLQVGDQLELQFYKTPELNTRVRVRPDGRIAVQLVDEIDAAGRTPAELDAALTDAYRRELRDPKITVSVVEHGALRVYVGGEVEAPTMLRLDGELSAFQAIQQAGGFANTAAVDAVILIRRGADGKAIGTEIDLSQVSEGRDPARDVALQAQDILFVPRSRIANVNLFVEQYIRNNLPVTPTFGMGLGTF
jgi:protein involved in polysaccharide export with SLBB domain